MIHIYCGDGKGKTTAGMGLCLRAAGAGKKVLIYQFLKGPASSERKILENVPGIMLAEVPENMTFLRWMPQHERENLKKVYARVLETMCKTLKQGDFSADVIFLDEVLYAIGKDMVSEDTVECLLKSGPEKEWILTGRYSGDRLKCIADYISVIQKEKHPYDFGIMAREGIEY